MSVAEQAKVAKLESMSMRLLSQLTATASLTATTDPGPPVEIEAQTPMETLTENKPQDYEDMMSVDENEEYERPTEIGQILDELADGARVEDTTLLRLSEDDVGIMLL